jgi:D-cysteine desulfhydrase family pyridoxal phosphate-dependent enzyme
MEIKTFPRIRLATLPTPLCELRNLSAEVGTEIWIKRDDLTGFAGGGNKVRKAEFLLADAQEKSADAVLTVGPTQSNHSRVIAAGARMLGKECHLFLTGPKPDNPSANLLLDVLSGAKIHWAATPDSREPEMIEFAEKMRKKGRVPYAIEVGGSNPIGAWGYVEGLLELDRQLEALPPKPNTLVFASSSAGTHAGLLAGKVMTSSKTKLLGIRIDSDPGLERTICMVGNGCLKMQGMEQTITENEVHLNSDYIGEGYGVPTAESIEAMKRLWRSECILLDLVYTAKAMGGLIDLAQSGAFVNERVIFLHSGGVAAFFGSTSYMPLTTLLR